jgi:hypothetical protein
MDIGDDIAELERGDVRFERLVAICERHFVGRQGKGSHLIFKTPWAGDPRINLQRSKGSGEAKQYQVRQVLAALRRLQGIQAASKLRGE